MASSSDFGVMIVDGGIGRRCPVQILLKPGVNVLCSNAIAQEQTVWADTAQP